MVLVRYLLAAFLVIASLDSGAETPDWFQESLQRMAPDTSIWVADNSAYQSNKEPFEAYVMEWRWGLGKQSAVGRLYGLVDGVDAGTFWEFRAFWHPEEQSAYVQQFGGDGTFGSGKLEPDGKHKDILTQVFHSSDGKVTHVGHETIHQEDSNEGTSFDILPDGSWKKRRTYVWHRELKENT